MYQSYSSVVRPWHQVNQVVFLINYFQNMQNNLFSLCYLGLFIRNIVILLLCNTGAKRRAPPHLRPISFNFMHFLPENRMCAPPFVTKQRPPIWINPGSATVLYYQL